MNNVHLSSSRSSSHSDRFDRFLLQAETSGKVLQADTLRHDLEIETIQKSIAKMYATGNNEASVIEKRIVDLAGKIHDSLTNAEANQTFGWVEYFRLTSRLHFLRQHIMAPFAFSDYRNYEERRQIVDGAYGLNAQTIESALDLYDLTTHSLKEQQELRGVINEETVNALINYQELPSEFSELSNTSDDHFYKRDINLWLMQKRTMSLVHLQVKSSHLALSNHIQSEDRPVICVHAGEFDNVGPLLTSRRIVDDANGTISNENKAKLDATRHKFMTSLYGKIDDQLRQNSVA